MPNLVLVIGNKAYSSWSLRPWLLMKQAGIAFEELRLSLYAQDARKTLLLHSPTGRVPVLRDAGITIWDSLAISEYLAEKYPRMQLWPVDVAARAHARAISAEMHSSFMTLRHQMPMNVRRKLPVRAKSAELDADIARVETIWNECRSRYSAAGPYLFGGFCIADAMYAPVASRLHTYGVPLGGAAGQYAMTIQALPAMQEWIAGARTETEVNPQYEA
jgi:glutathione S-transferase